MPGLTAHFPITLAFRNDTPEPASVQLQRDYGRQPPKAVVVHAGESLELVLEAGATYRYCVKRASLVANVSCVLKAQRSLWLLTVSASARGWRDLTVDVSGLFPGGPLPWPLRWYQPSVSLVNGVTLEKLWDDPVFAIFPSTPLRAGVPPPLLPPPLVRAPTRARRSSLAHHSIRAPLQVDY
jgi:hypothetical protein